VRGSKQDESKRELELPHTVMTCPHTPAAQTPSQLPHTSTSPPRASPGHSQANSAPIAHPRPARYARHDLHTLNMHGSEQHTPNHQMPDVRTGEKTPRAPTTAAVAKRWQTPVTHALLFWHQGGPHRTLQLHTCLFAHARRPAWHNPRPQTTSYRLNSQPHSSITQNPAADSLTNNSARLTT
jgi:hypothetical protein